MHVQESAKTAAEAVVTGTVVGAILGWLPHIAALLGVIWWLIRLYETKTIQNLLKKLKKIAKDESR